MKKSWLIVLASWIMLLAIDTDPAAPGIKKGYKPKKQGGLDKKLQRKQEAEKELMHGVMEKHKAEYQEKKHKKELEKKRAAFLKDKPFQALLQAAANLDDAAVIKLLAHHKFTPKQLARACAEPYITLKYWNDPFSETYNMIDGTAGLIQHPESPATKIGRAAFEKMQTHEKTKALAQALAPALPIWSALLKAGANLNEIDMDDIIVDWAAHGLDDGLRFLLQTIAAHQLSYNINYKNFYGKTALMVAAINNHPSTVDILLRAGADPDIKDEKGRSFRSHYADLYDDVAIVWFLFREERHKTTSDILKTHRQALPQPAAAPSKFEKEKKSYAASSSSNARTPAPGVVSSKIAAQITEEAGKAAAQQGRVRTTEERNQRGLDEPHELSPEIIDLISDY